MPIANSADYRQVSGTFSITLSGFFYPCKSFMKVILIAVILSSNFHRSSILTQSVNHWSNEDKVIDLIEKVLLPYVRNKIADMFKRQWKDKVKSLIKKYHGKMVPVPHNTTNYFQPLNLTVNLNCFCVIKLKYGMQNKCRTKFPKKLLQKECIC